MLCYHVGSRAATTMPARAIDLPEELLAIAKIRERSARIEILPPDASSPRGRNPVVFH
jgi:hypothetical protein